MALTIEIIGTPIAGEHRRENDWVQRVLSACCLESVTLHFHAEPGRKIDLDNLVRPAMRGLKSAGLYVQGYRNLDKLAATKSWSETPGLTIESGALPVPTPALLDVTFASVPPSDSSSEWKRNWASAVH